jgi:hypothetical protein
MAPRASQMGTPLVLVSTGPPQAPPPHPPLPASLRSAGSHNRSHSFGSGVSRDKTAVATESVCFPLGGAEGTPKRVPRAQMSDNTTLTARERLRIHLREARRTTDSPIVEAQLAAALDASNDLPPTPLRECPICGKVGLPERIQQHRCDSR